MPKFKDCIVAILFVSSPALADVRGLYGSDCLPFEGLSAKKDLLFKAETMENVQTVYRDTMCSLPAYDLSFVGAYVLNKQTHALDYTYETIKLRVLDAHVADAFNAIALCGSTHWLVNEDRDVAGVDCGGQQIPTSGTAVFDRVRETDLGIELGLTNEIEDGMSQERRPLEWDPHSYTAR